MADDRLKQLNELIEDAEGLSTDSAHPLDEKQARRLTMMLQRQTSIVIAQIYNVQLEMQRQMADMLVNLEARRGVINERVRIVEEDVKDIKDAMKGLPKLAETVDRIDRTVTEYPSLTWLLRHKFSNTSRAIVALLVLIYLVYRSYPALAAWWGLPPVP